MHISLYIKTGYNQDKTQRYAYWLGMHFACTIGFVTASGKVPIRDIENMEEVTKKCMDAARHMVGQDLIMFQIMYP